MDEETDERIIDVSLNDALESLVNYESGKKDIQISSDMHYNLKVNGDNQVFTLLE